MVPTERSRSDLSGNTQSISNFINIFFYLHELYGEKRKMLGVFLHIFSEIYPKFSDFVNSDDCNGKIKSKYIRL